MAYMLKSRFGFQARTAGQCELTIVVQRVAGPLYSCALRGGINCHLSAVAAAQEVTGHEVVDLGFRGKQTLHPAFEHALVFAGRGYYHAH